MRCSAAAAGSAVRNRMCAEETAVSSRQSKAQPTTRTLFGCIQIRMEMVEYDKNAHMQTGQFHYMFSAAVRRHSTKARQKVVLRLL